MIISKNSLSIIKISLVLASAILCVDCKAKAEPSHLDKILDKADSRWVACQIHTNCIVSFGPCGEWVAVNRNFVKEQQAWAIKAGSVFGCPENKSPKPEVSCHEQVCVIQP